MIFKILWIVATIAWIIFLCLGMTAEMVIANIYMWIGALGINFCKRKD